MGQKETFRTIKNLIKGKAAFIEVVVSAKSIEEIKLSENIHVIPIKNLGNQHVVDYGKMLLDKIGIKYDDTFHQDAVEYSKNYSYVNLIIYLGLTEEILKAVRSERYVNEISQTHSLLSFYTCSRIRPILHIDTTISPIEVKFFSPPEKSSVNRSGDDPITADFLSKCLTDDKDDEKLYYWLSLLEETQYIDNPKFKMARLFSILESMSSKIHSSMQEQQNKIDKDKKIGTRHAVRTLLGYFSSRHIPSFHLFNPATNEMTQYEFDHIELAGRVRDKIFHGSEIKGLGDKLKEAKAIIILKDKPEMINKALRKDCESVIIEWIEKKGTICEAENGKEFTVPTKEEIDSYNGNGLPRWMIVTTTENNGSIKSILMTGPETTDKEINNGVAYHLFYT